MTRKKRGRPMANIDEKQFEKLCAMQCTEEEICGFFGVTDKTLVRWCKRTYGVGFSDVYKEKRQMGRISLRRSQIRLSETNATMAIWLGKQWLGQRDEVHVDADVETVQIIDDIPRKEQ